MHNLNKNKKKKNNSIVTATATAVVVTIPMAGIIVAAALLPGLLSLINGGYYYQPAIAQKQNMTSTKATTITDGGGGGGAQSACGTTIQTGGGNQSTSEARSHIEQACMALQNNDIQGALMELDLALNALVSSSNVTTTAGGNATNATGGGGGGTTAKAEAAGVNQTRSPIVLEVQGTTNETIEDVQQRMVEEINSDPRLTAEQKTQLINQLSAEVAQLQPETVRAADCQDEDNWVIVIHYAPPPIRIEIQCDGTIIADIIPLR